MSKYYPKLSADTAPRTIILANGAYPECPLALELIRRWSEGGEGYRLICCDGAVNKLLQHTGLLPDAVVGDLDSISPELRRHLEGRIHHRPDQETNDLTKAMNFVAHELSLRAVTLLGISGGREDHLLGNIALLPGYASMVDELLALTDEGHFRLISSPSVLEVERGQQVSLFDFFGSPLTARGLHWPLESFRLPYLWSGTLNRADQEEIYLEAETPLLVFLAKQCKPLNHEP